jgi:anti-sigma factor RsiW
MEHERWEEWVDLAADGGLGVAERQELDRHLAACAACRAALADAEAVLARLAAARVDVRPGFAREVLAAVEPAPWEARTLRAWRLPLALLALVGGASAAILGFGAAELTPGGGSGGALAVLVDLLRAAFVAGSGLAAASWQGLGSAIGAWLGASAVNWLAAIALAGGANYFLWRLVRARPAAAGERARR